MQVSSPDERALAQQIDAILPQTQCGQCSYPGCMPYAEAIAAGVADINQCPPGGQAGINALAQLLGIATKALNPTHGIEQPLRIAFVDEANCIGCTLCIQACPVDAILGASKQMHTVLLQECTGCELCVAPCPTACISMQAVPTTLASQPHPYPVYALRPAKDRLAAAHARSRYQFRRFRLEREQSERSARLAAKAELARAPGGSSPTATEPQLSVSALPLDPAHRTTPPKSAPC